MAPRRGGSSGGGSGVSIDNQCSDYGAFSDDYSKAQIGLLGGFLLLFLILAFCVSSRSGKRKKAHLSKPILRWYQYGIAIFLIIALFILLIVRYALLECHVLYRGAEDTTAIGVTTVVVNNVAELFMIGLVMFVIQVKMFQLAGSESIRRIFKILNVVCFTIVCLVFGAYIILYGLITYRVAKTTTSQSIKSYSRLVQAYVVLYALLAIFAIIGLVLATFRLRRKPERKEGITGWVPVLLICVLGYAFYNVVVVFIDYYDYSYNDAIGSIVGYGISLLFFFGAYFSMFMISRSAGWEWLDGSGPVAMQDAYNFASGQHMSTATYPNQTPYDTMQTDANKRASYASHGMPPTPTPPYAPGQMVYSGGGVYEHDGQTYSTGNWGSGGYAPVHQMPTAYSAPMGAASREMEHNELTGRR
ncbi:hypothetical protein TWF694_009447 [Orbilia ellipsospora]|uniref:Uncharacterized protein n=1 Tax=Orbilia ellipsospora TaxID=2528407 RepID=A0AAV9XBW8_9PEZI